VGRQHHFVDAPKPSRQHRPGRGALGNLHIDAAAPRVTAASSGRDRPPAPIQAAGAFAADPWTGPTSRWTTINLALNTPVPWTPTTAPRPDTPEAPWNPHGPGVNPSEPGMNPHGPSRNSHDPGVNPHEPSLNTHDPGMNSREPSLNSREPGMNTDQVWNELTRDYL
jgi:hypothetical protein